MGVIDLEQKRAERAERARREIEAEITEDFRVYFKLFSLVDRLPKSMVVQLVIYCLNKHVKLSDLRSKFDY